MKSYHKEIISIAFKPANAYVAVIETTLNHFLNGAIPMPNFERYVASLGEFGVQDIIERLERYEGIRTNRDIPLEDRWNDLMNVCPVQQCMAA